MQIRKKILLLVAMAMLTCAAVSGFGLYGLRLVNANVVQISGNSVPALILVSEMRNTYLVLIPQVFARATADDPEKGKDLEKRIDDGSQNLIKQINDYTARTTDEDEKKALTEAKFRLSLFITRLKQINSLASMGEKELAIAAIQNDIEPIHQRLSAAFDELVKMNVGNTNSVAESAANTFGKTLALTVSVALIGVVIIGVMGFLFGRSITGPLQSMQQAIMRTAQELDFTVPITVHTRDEIGQTLEAYNTLLARLRSSFAEIQNASARMAALMADVDRTSKEIAENSHAQSDASAGMAAAVEELSVSISMVASQARDASEHTVASRDVADRGSEVILSTVNGIQTISSSVRDTSARIATLRSDSESIASVANIIKEIAEQTNLLALNAAIEAARAGEQGRGFAVVADEVRKLAERTAKSTQEISGLLGKMQTGAREAVDAMALAVSEVNTGVDNARRAGEAIGAIRQDSSAVVGVVGEISEAVREQSAASTSISQRIEQIAQMTERNTAAAETTAEAIHRMSEMSHEILEALKAYRV